ncbi:hypothetical protein AJ78_08542 [Emergomyces pasteurianus Ep9510]|uniref:Uncharacterized protein n=1 Tax=Emergomyces pasteurianus Ep9510 TaxID=1447872 RepID=A0A1J9P0X4_9EURO|nr:hypothetical protein AJ78_08542 [Emergomyces pasteurianus Ep9510]
MSIIKDVAFASGPVPDVLQACFSKPKQRDSPESAPGKRRKLNTGIWDSQDIAAALFPEYLTLAHIELKIVSVPP